MNDLLEQAIAAHGGLDRWNTVNEVTATMLGGGGLWPMKGFEPAPIPTEVTVTLHQEKAIISPFGQPDWRAVFKPDRIAIESTSGALVDERSNPRASFAGHVMNTPWNLLDRAYFSGYARWTYLTTPFLMTMPGFEVEEIPPWREGDELWRGLRARFPNEIASHSKEQDFYFGDDFLLRRHDYNVEIAGGFPAVQYVSDIVEAGGLRFPTKRRAYLRGPGLKPIRDLLMVSIDLSNFQVR
ncbi:MAG TPA: hypothetical protein VI306_24470 [Pyrinomonadaceae bacterium]